MGARLLLSARMVRPSHFAFCFVAVFLPVTHTFFLGCSTESGVPSVVERMDAGASDSAPRPTLDASAPTALGMNDVSVLLPLPRSIAAPGYLTPDTQGRGGALFPADVYARVPAFSPIVSSFERAALKALAIRFDGCFRKESTAPCEAQIRMVMQPIAVASEGGGGAIGDDPTVEATDSAVHLFYRMSESDFPTLVSELRRLRSLIHDSASNLPLQVSPPLAADGIDGPYGTALNNLVLKFAGAENLVRVTFFLRTPSRTDQWDFGGFVRAGAEWKPLEIPGVGSQQRVSLPVSASPKYHYVVEPLSMTPEDLTLPLSSDEMEKATSAAREGAMISVMRVENPRLHSADSIQCVACHVAAPIAASAVSRYGMKLESFTETYASFSGRNLRQDESASARSFALLRAFGWGGPTPAISRRVIHETAEVLDDLDRRFPGP